MSVIIPVYNRASLVRETLDALRRQRYRPLEVIVVDDGSTDGTMAELRLWLEAARLDAELRCHLIGQENRGAAAARNRGRRQATGKYIHFLDSDDVVGAHFYSKLVAVLEAAPGCAFAWGEWIPAEDATAAVAQLPDPGRVGPVSGATPCNNAWCGLFRASAIPAGLEWNESLQNHNDWDYTTRFLLTNPAQLLHVAIPLLAYRTHAGLERLGRIRTPESLQAVLHAVDGNARMLARDGARRRNVPARVLAVRFSTEYITLLFATLETNALGLKLQAARGVLRHATCRQSWFWNAVGLALLCLLPCSGTALGKRALRGIRRRFGDIPLTTTRKG